MNGYHSVKVFRFPNFEVGDEALMPDGYKPTSIEYNPGSRTLIVCARKWHRRERLPVRTRAAKRSA